MYCDVLDFFVSLFDGDDCISILLLLLLIQIVLHVTLVPVLAMSWFVLNKKNNPCSIKIILAKILIHPVGEYLTNSTQGLRRAWRFSVEWNVTQRFLHNNDNEGSRSLFHPRFRKRRVPKQLCWARHLW